MTSPIFSHHTYNTPPNHLVSIFLLLTLWSAISQFPAIIIAHLCYYHCLKKDSLIPGLCPCSASSTLQPEKSPSKIRGIMVLLYPGPSHAFWSHSEEKAKSLPCPWGPLCIRAHFLHSFPTLSLSFCHTDLAGFWSCTSNSSHLFTLKCVVDFRMLFFRYLCGCSHIFLTSFQMSFYWEDLHLTMFLNSAKYYFPFALQHRKFLSLFSA